MPFHVHDIKVRCYTENHRRKLKDNFGSGYQGKQDMCKGLFCVNIKAPVLAFKLITIEIEI